MLSSIDILNFISFVLDFKDHPNACPPKFSNLEKHTNKSHGDVCRNEKLNGYNIGWTCPEGCIASPDPDVAPFCKMSASDNTPCRIASKFFHVFQGVSC